MISGLKAVKDPYGREVTGLRLSVTSRCDMECIYCHKEGQGALSEEMSLSEIDCILRIARDMGISRVKITGGEPLLRKEICKIVAAAAKYMEHVSLTTNGAKLAVLALDLKKAGLRQINISLDTLDRNKYREITGKDSLKNVLSGIAVATVVGFSPVKLNMVVLRGINENEIERVMGFARQIGAVLQLIELENIWNREFYEKYHSDFTPIESWLMRHAERIEERKTNGRRIYYIPNPVEVVKPMHNTRFCANCHRIRITSDGKLKPCLMTNDGNVDIVGLIRQGADDSKLKEAFEKAIQARGPFWK